MIGLVKKLVMAELLMILWSPRTVIIVFGCCRVALALRFFGGFVFMPLFITVQ